MSVLRAIALLGLSVVLIGCGDAAVGSWELDAEKTIALFEESAKEEEGGEMMLAIMKPMLESAKVEIEMRGDKTFTATSKFGPQNDSIEGTWKKVDGGYELKPNDANEQTMTAEIKSGRMLLAPPGAQDGPTLYLKKG